MRRGARAHQELAEVREEVASVERRHPRLAVVVDVLRAISREQSDERVGLAAAGAAFWVVISAIPTAIAVVASFGLALSPERVAADLGSLTSAVPGSFGALMTQQLQHVATSDHAGLTKGLVVSVLLALWTASAGVYHLDAAVRDAYDLPPQRYLEARGRALLGAVAVVAVLGVAASARPLLEATSSGPLLLLGVPLAFLVLAVGVGALYRFAADSSVTGREVWPGAVASAIGVLLVTVGFGTYVGHSGHYTAVYGAFAGAVIGMFGVYLAVYVVLLGAVLNITLTRRHR